MSRRRMRWIGWFCVLLALLFLAVDAAARGRGGGGRGGGGRGGGGGFGGGAWDGTGSARLPYGYPWQAAWDT